MARINDVTRELSVAARLAIARIGRAPDRSAAEPDPEAFAEACAALMTKAPSGLVASHHQFRLPSDQPPWFDTGLDLAAGETVTSLAVGRTWLARALDIWVGARFQLWFRIGEHGEAFRGTRRSHSFEVPEGGRLYLASYFPGEWADRTGAIAAADAAAYRGVDGALGVLLIRWRGEAAAGIRALAAEGDVDGLLAGEADRLADPPQTPRDWSYLWTLGPAEIFSRIGANGERPRFVCETQGDVGILQKDVSQALTPEVRLTWRWKMDALPSALREDTLPSHDYLSLAVAFDNGQDLTYFWSVSLPPGRVFRCPLPHWDQRETHMVLRSGKTGLGAWQSEDRALYNDYVQAIGAPPKRIVQVWLIANSLFQRRPGRCEYADIVLSGPDGEIRVD